MDYDLIKFKTLIEKKAGIQITDDAKLRFAIGEMIAASGIDSESELYEHVSRRKDDFENLVGFLTINETYFFRESSQINVFSNELVPSLLKTHKTGKINILSAGCSTGAEPYSLVIALMEKYGTHIGHLFSVNGFDIDKKALMIAKGGVFGKYHFRGLEERLIEKYFDKNGDGKYKIKPIVSDLVGFYPHNLLHSPPPGAFAQSHVIFYRNVAIYFSPENQKKIFINLSDMLCKNGWLVMSSTETLPHDFKVLSLTKVKQIFVYRKKESDVKNQDIPAAASYTKKTDALIGRECAGKKINRVQHDSGYNDRHDRLRLTVEPESPSPEVQIQAAWELAGNKKYSESLMTIDRLTRQPSPPAKAYTIKAGVLMNLNELAKAKVACLKAIDIDEFLLDAFLLLGIISKLENNLEDSEEKLKKSIYIDSSCWLAHYYLAEIYRSRGEIEKSFKKYEIVIKQLEKVKTTDTNVLFGAFSFSEKELIQACRNNLERLKS